MKEQNVARSTRSMARGHAVIDGNAIEIIGLEKRFGSTKALDRVDLSVPTGSVFGFLGPNGAGKTTALRILTGLAFPSAGTARILGRDVSVAGNEVRSQIGYLPDVPGFYGWMTAPQFLQYVGRLFGLGRDAIEERGSALLDMAGLTGVRTTIAGLSRGMKQRLGIAQALINAPQLLLLDEPTSALDPIGRREVLDMIASLRGRTTVFFSTHILADVERVCDRVAILHRGRVVANATTAELKRRAAVDRLTLEVDGDPETLVADLTRQPWVRSLERSGARLSLTVADLAQAQREIPAAVVRSGVGLRRLESGEVSLEDVFVNLIEPNEQ